MIKIVIPGNPITKKNSQRIIQVAGRPMIIPSKQYKIYESQAYDYMPSDVEMIDTPVNIRCVYYMKTRRKVDLVNLEEATLDILTHWNVLSDDNSRVVVSMDGSRVKYDKDNPRAEITIEEVEG